MRIAAMENGRLAEFIDYCRRHRGILDDSYLNDDELEKYVPSAQNPAFLLVDDKGKVIGAVSLILSEYLVRGNQARFRIFHSIRQEAGAYLMMFDAVLP